MPHIYLISEYCTKSSLMFHKAPQFCCFHVCSFESMHLCMYVCGLFKTPSIAMSGRVSLFFLESGECCKKIIIVITLAYQRDIC